MDTPHRSAFERHLQTALAVIMVGVVGWVGVTITSLSTSQARMEITVTYIAEDVAVLNKRLEDMDFASLAAQVRALHTQYVELERYQSTIWPRLREMKDHIRQLEPKDANNWKY